MEERRELIAIPNGQVRVTIRDIANIVLASSELTGLVFGAITKLVQQGLVQGVKAIYLIIDGLRTEIEIIKANSDITRADIKRTLKLTNFEHTIADYTAAKERVFSKIGFYDEGFRQEWLRRVEESFYKEMAQIAADF